MQQQPHPASLVARLRRWARELKQETYALYLACRHPRTPWPARVVAGCVAAYAFSPIDLIPDFIPILGYLDDLLLVPLGLLLVRKMIPADVLAECRAMAKQAVAAAKPVNYLAAAVIVMIWLALAGAVGLWIWKRLSEP